MERWKLVEELARAIAAIELDHPVRVAVDGVGVAGKTVLADELAGPVSDLGRSVIRGSVDGFHNPRKVRHRRGAESPEGYYRDSFDYEAMRSALLDPLGPGGSLRYRTALFDFRTDSAVESPVLVADPSSVVIVDGIFLLKAELRRHWDFSIFVHASFETTLARAETRDVALFGSPEAVRERYLARYIPGERMYLELDRPRDRADVVVVNDDPASARLEWRAAVRADHTGGAEADESALTGGTG